MIDAACVLGTLLSAWAFQEERIDDTEYEKNVSVHVKAVQAVEKTWRKDPAAALKSIEAALKAIEEELAPRHSRLIEATIAVRATRGIDKGEIKERQPFFPYRLGGEIALAAGEPERAVALLQRSPSSAALLAEAKKAVAARGKKDPSATTPSPTPPPSRPVFDPKPFLDRHDFAGALESLKTQRTVLGADADRIADDVRREASRHQQSTIAVLAGVLPRLDQPGFRKDHVEPCLESCARVPADLESEELRWVRRLDRWLDKRDPAEFEPLAIAAAKFGGDFTVLVDRAQDDRLREIETLVQTVNQAVRSERPRLLDQLVGAERALGDLAAARPRADLKDRLAAQKAKLPLDDKALDEARARPSGIADIRRLADELDRLWVSDRRARLSVPDQKDLALLLGIYRCMALFLEGKTVAQAAQDLRLVEVFRSAGELPSDVSPKVAAVRARIIR
jgi:hypothetical protein